MTNQKTQSLIFLALILAGILSIINIYVVSGRFGEVQEAQALAKELMRPADLEVIRLVASDCKDCYPLENVLSKLEGMNTNVKDERTISFDSPEGKSLVNQYDITKLPVLIVSGEINKTEQLHTFFTTNGFVDDGHAVYTNIMPPYYDAASNSVVGRVALIYLEDASCKECSSLKQMDAVLKQAGVGIGSVETYDYTSPTAQQLISTYGVAKIPALLISKDIEAYPNLQQQLIQADISLKNDYYVMPAQLAPYHDLQKDTIVGMATLIMLKDDSCTECYDVTVNKAILSRLGIIINNQETYDLATTSAKALLDKYKITKVPVILISPDAQYYPSFTAVWNSVGSTESDGWYVMRKPELLGAYKDLTTNEVVKPQKQPPEQSASNGE